MEVFHNRILDEHGSPSLAKVTERKLLIFTNDKIFVKTTGPEKLLTAIRRGIGVDKINRLPSPHTLVTTLVLVLNESCRE